MAAQVAQDHVESEARAHGDGIGVHQAAGGVLVEGQYSLDPLAILGAHGGQYFWNNLTG